MKILMILSKEFTVDLRVFKEAESLVEAGHKVTVLMWDRKGEHETESTVEGIKVIRMRNTSFMKILPNDLFRNPFWWRNAYKKGLKLFKNGFNFDVVHCHDLDTLKIGIWLKKKLKVKLVYDAHEIFGYMIEKDVPNFIVKFVFNMEKKLIQYVDEIITVNKPVESYLKKIVDKSITIVMNCKNPLYNKYKPPKNKVFTISFIGTFEKGRFFPEIVDLIGNVEKIKFIIAGKKEHFKLYKIVEKTSAKYDNIEFLGQIPFNHVLPLTFKTDVVIYPIDSSTRNSKIITPNKLFEAMACGRPLICSKKTHAGYLTEKLQCGIAADSSLDSIKKAVLTLRDNPELCRKFGENGLKAAIREYNWDKQKEKLIELYKKLS